jgi:hypothetical protein
MDTKKSAKSVQESVLSELNDPENQGSNPDSIADDSSSEDGINQDAKEKDEPETSSPNNKVYKTLDGRDVTADQLFEEYDHLARDYTRKSQELSTLKKTETVVPEKPEDMPAELSAQDEAVLKELKRFKIVTEDDVDKLLAEREGEVVSKAARVSTAQIELKSALDELVTDYDFVDRGKVLDFIIENPNTSLSPLDIARTLHYDEFVKLEVNRAPERDVLPETESSGVSQTDPVKPTYRFKDGSAERAVRELLKD